MGWLFGGNKTNSQSQPAVTNLQVQTSAYGQCIAFGFGTNRVAPELIWYGAFTSYAQTSGGGGKGGGSVPGSTTYTYTTSLILALGEGPILGVRKSWVGKNQGSSINYPQVHYPGFTLFTGSYSQTEWSYLDNLIIPSNGSIAPRPGGSYTTNRTYYIRCSFTSSSGETLANTETSIIINNTSSGLRPHHLLNVQPPVQAPAGATGWNLYVSLSAGTEKKQNASPLGLNTDWTEPTSGLVDHGSVPVADTSLLSQALNYRGIAYLASANYHLGQNPNLDNHNFEVQWSNDFGDDADPSIVINTILTNTKYGTIFPSANVASLTTYQNYCYATGMFVSPLYNQQKAAAEILTEIAQGTNSEIVFSSGKINVVPYGDQTITGNGKTYTAPSPVYDLTYDDFVILNQGDDPVMCTRQDGTQFYNSIKMEYVNRANQYASDFVEYKDQAMIDTFGIYQDASRDGKIFALTSAAKTSVQLQGQRQQIRNLYTFNLDQRFIGLDPMDIVTLTDAKLGLNKQWVRIREITENEDTTLTLITEEVLDGTGSSATYSTQDGTGYNVDYNVDPGDTNALIVFEAPTQITTNGGLETWIAVSGGPLWGGCDFYIATNNVDYALAPPRQIGPARMGVLAYDVAGGDTTITVNLGESFGQLTSGTATDAQNGVTLCYLDGEFLAYQTATLVQPYVYTLTGCKRGMYGSTAAAHSAGSAFARLDSQIFKYPHSKLQNGQALGIRALSFNIYGGGQQIL